MLVKNILKTLCQYKIDIYLDFPNIVNHDAGINFDFMKFYNKTKMLDIICH